MEKNIHQIVALVGRPNVGKSSLFNKLTKSNKAIIDPTPGVTRDRHYETVAWDGHKFILVDTGGIELEKMTQEQLDDPEKRMSQLIKEQSLQAVEEADIIVFILDGKEGLLNDDYEMAKLLRKSKKTIYYVVNKVDSEMQETSRLAPFYELGVEELHPVSAAHGYGIGTFMDVMTQNFLRDEEPKEEIPENTMRIAFLGRPNVGKSSLTNQLLGEDRMVVSDIPGTTRDSVDTLFQRKGRNYLLIDTAGIRRRGKVKDKVEKFSVMRALSSIERCDIALILIDADEGITEQDTKVIGYCVERGRACLVVLNKWDLLNKEKKRQKHLLDEVERSTRFIGYSPTVKISALTGFGIKNIYSTLHKVFEQFSLKFSTGKINRVLQSAVEAHPPSLYKGHRLKFYYSTQVTTKPPTFIIFVNYPKGVHFSYYRFLVNHFRAELNLDLTILRIFLRERQRKKYG